MQLSKSALSLFFLLGCSTQFQSTSAFSPSAASFVRSAATQKQSPLTQQRMVTTSEPIAVADMQRGIGGRLEDAFESAKERGESAFVTFVTAGYPRAQGMFGFCFLMLCML
jgi:hypothetical protein